MAYRNTISDVRGIIDTDLDDREITPFLSTANALVDEVVIGEGYSDAILKQIEGWLAAHFIAIRDPRVSREKVDDAEEAGSFTPATWLLEQRPDRDELVADAGRQIGIDESVLATLARAVTFPHWELVAQSWLPEDSVEGWTEFRCPTCGGVPGLVEIRAARSGDEGIAAATRRLMHCPFCGSRWAIAALRCPACDSTRAGDAKYYYTDQEPELRIDFCKSCKHYVKVVNADRITGRLHVGLELLTTTHLDTIAQDKNLEPLELCS